MRLDIYDVIKDEIERCKNINHALADLYTQIRSTQELVDNDDLYFTSSFRSFAVVEQLANCNLDNLRNLLKKLELEGDSND